MFEGVVLLLQRSIFDGSFLHFIIDNHMVEEALQGSLRHYRTPARHKFDTQASIYPSRSFSLISSFLKIRKIGHSDICLTVSATFESTKIK